MTKKIIFRPFPPGQQKLRTASTGGTGKKSELRGRTVCVKIFFTYSHTFLSGNLRFILVAVRERQMYFAALLSTHPVPSIPFENFLITDVKSRRCDLACALPPFLFGSRGNSCKLSYSRTERNIEKCAKLPPTIQGCQANGSSLHRIRVHFLFLCSKLKSRVFAIFV